MTGELDVQPAPRRMPVGTIIALAMILTGIVCAVIINMKRHEASKAAVANAKPRTVDDLPKLGMAPIVDFALTNQSGKTVTLAELRGRVWVAETFFSYCGAYCPRMHRNLSKLQFEFDDKNEPKFVSVSVDPGRDTVKALDEYARTQQADPERWWFLTGDVKDLKKLADSLLLGFVPGVPSSHSLSFVLVDRDGWVRGAYHASDVDDPELDVLREDLRLLLAAPSKKN